MTDDLTCTNCGEYAGSPISDRVAELEAENARLREALIHLRGAYDCADVVDAALQEC